MGNILDEMSGTISVVTCDECLGFGAIFWGNAEDYHVEPCDCVTNEIGEY
jgi:hypothetical protein